MAADPRPSVLMVTGAYFPELSSGGLQCRAVARLLRDRVRVRVLTTAIDPDLPERSMDGDVEVSRVVVGRAGAARRLAAHLLRLVSASDVVHLHGYSRKNIPVSIAAKLFRAPIVLSLHTSNFDEPATIAAHGAPARWSLRAASLYLTVSRALTEACARAGLPRERVREVANGVDLDRFRPAAAAERPALRRALGLPADPPVVLFVGFFSREKQPDVLFDAWRRARQAGWSSTLVFVGATQSAYFEVDDRLAADIRARATAAGAADAVVFVDPTPRIEDYYRAADVFVLPSSREGLPVALLEAMACGLPAVASRLPGATDVAIEDGVSGVLVPPGDAAALGDALSRILSDRAFAAALGAAARDRAAARFSAQRTADGWLEAYRAVGARFPEKDDPTCAA